MSSNAFPFFLLCGLMVFGCSASDSSDGTGGGTGGDASTDAGSGGGMDSTAMDTDVPASPSTLAAEPTEFRIPTLAAGRRADRTVVLTNSGDAPIQITRFALEFSGGQAQMLYGVRQLIGISADGEDLLAAEERYPLELSPGTMMPVTLEYTANDDTPAGSLTITGDFEGGTLVLPIEVISSVGELSVTPNTVDFGRVRSMTESTIAITVTNSGMLPLNFNRIETGDNVNFEVLLGETDPTIDARVYNDPDQDGEAGLAPGAGFELTARFAPTREGTQTSFILLDTDDPVNPSVRIPLVGNPVTGCIDVSHETLEWEGVVREVTASPEVSITNCGDQPLTLDRLGLLAGSSQNFAFEPLMNVPDSFPAEIPPGAAPITFRVDYGPPDARRYRGNVEILSNDPENHTVIIPLEARSRCMADADCAMGYRCEGDECVEVMQMMP